MRERQQRTNLEKNNSIRVFGTMNHTSSKCTNEVKTINQREGPVLGVSKIISGSERSVPFFVGGGGDVPFEMFVTSNCSVAARDTRFDVVLVDTAGRMQDNEPLMRALAKVNARRKRRVVLDTRQQAIRARKKVQTNHLCGSHVSVEKFRVNPACDTFVWSLVFSGTPVFWYSDSEAVLV